MIGRLEIRAVFPDAEDSGHRRAFPWVGIGAGRPAFRVGRSVCLGGEHAAPPPSTEPYIAQAQRHQCSEATEYFAHVASVAVVVIVMHITGSEGWVRALSLGTGR